jgi:hydroxyacylglutathione hydrolase
MADLLGVQWIHGSPDCATNDDEPLQVHAFDDETYILRENKCVNFEGPFLYLLFGTEKALLLDTRGGREAVRGRASQPQ